MKGKVVDFQNLNRICPKCQLPPTADGHDPCISNLPGVKYACCGHGKRYGYVKYNSGQIVMFDNPQELTCNN